MTRFFGFPKKIGKVETGFSGTRKMSAFFRVPEKKSSTVNQDFREPEKSGQFIVVENSKIPKQTQSACW